MKKVLDIDLWVAIFFSALLLWVSSVEQSELTFFINYLYLIYFMLRLVALIVSFVRMHRKEPCYLSNMSWGTPLRTIALIVFFVVALMNIAS